MQGFQGGWLSPENHLFGGVELSRVSRAMRKAPVSTAMAPLGVHKDGLSLAISPGLSKVPGSGGLWAGLLQACQKLELVLGQVTGLGPGNVIRTLLFFSNSLGVGFSDCS